jgi:hypothetical protein
VTIGDLRCDLCGRQVPGPAAGVRFGYHPGVAALRDDSGLACSPCWAEALRDLDTSSSMRCAACARPVVRRRSLHVRRVGVAGSSWNLCADHAVAFLNTLRTVEPKLDPATFRFPGDRPQPT